MNKQFFVWFGIAFPISIVGGILTFYVVGTVFDYSHAEIDRAINEKGKKSVDRIDKEDADKLSKFLFIEPRQNELKLPFSLQDGREYL
ncbi:MAG: hypothetical protein ACE5J2_07890 [Nitrososphaerales archaeon]